MTSYQNQVRKSHLKRIVVLFAIVGCWALGARPGRDGSAWAQGTANYKASEEAFARGKSKMEKGDYQGAIADFSKSAELTPQEVGPYYNRGLCYFNLGNYKTAFTDFSRCIQINPQYSAAYVNRSLLYTFAKRYPEAIADATTAIKIDPRIAGAWSNRAVAKSESGDFQGAIEDADAALEIDPRNSRAYNARGAGHIGLSQMQEANDDFTKAIAADPTYEHPYHNRGITLNYSGKFDDAIKDFQKAIELNPAYSEAYVGLGTTYSNKQSWREAIAAYRKSLQVAPQQILEPYIHFWIWQARMQLGEQDEANQELIVYVDNRLQKEPGDWASRIGAFLIGAMKEEALLAATHDENDLETRARLIQVSYYIGMMRLRNGDKPGATRFFQQSVQTPFSGLQWEKLRSQVELDRLKAH